MQRQPLARQTKEVKHDWHQKDHVTPGRPAMVMVVVAVAMGMGVGHGRDGQ